jgi:predicted component of type VI protein secretion system
VRSLFLLIAFSIVIVGCSQQQSVSQQISDCSSITIPSNKEVNTNIDKEKKILEASWYDDSKGKDVSVTIRYTDENCSESVQKLISHVID